MTMASQLGGAARRRLPQILKQTSRSIHFLPRISPSGRALSQRTVSPRAQHHYTPSSIAQSTSRAMMSTNPQREDDDCDEVDELNPSVLANIYNQQRAHYNRAVSALRKQYFAEIAEQRERERREKELAEAKLKREALERRRLKAMRSAENAQRQIEKAERRRLEWEKELDITQRERDDKKELYSKARQKIVDELEAECHLWLTTPEEVEGALGNPLASQKLWARAGGLIGAPSGENTGFGDFGEFWRYECHTWDARPTYKDPKEVMLEDFLHMSYLQANNNPNYWTQDRVEMEERKEQRARLRSIIREAGRRSLLNKQREMMRDVYGNNQGKRDDDRKGGRLPPTAMPAPKLDYLADYEAQEREGVEILKRDPQKFFIFESDLPSSHNLGKLHGNQDGDQSAEGSSTSGASLGRPVGLRNPFFNDKPTPFPLRMGRDLPADTRSEKEKKRDERQERMRAAAEEAALAAEKGMSYEIAMAAEEDLEDGSAPVDYDEAEAEAENELWVDQQDEWKDMDKKVFDMTPPAHRVTPDEIDWMIEQLQKKTVKMQEQLDFEDKMRRKEVEKSMSGGMAMRPIESLEEVDRYIMEGLGYDMGAMEQLVQDLTPEQSEILEKIDFTGRADITAEEMTGELNSVPGLTEDQIKMLVEMEMSLLKDQSFKNLM